MVVALDDKADPGRVRRDGRVFWGAGDVLGWEAQAAIQAGDELEELGDVLQLGTAPGEHNAADELVAKPGARIS